MFLPELEKCNDSSHLYLAPPKSRFARILPWGVGDPGWQGGYASRGPPFVLGALPEVCSEHLHEQGLGEDQAGEDFSFAGVRV